MTFDVTKKTTAPADDIIVDDTAPASTTGKANTVLAALEAELKRDVHLSDLVLNVPERKGMTIRFDVNIDAATVNKWRAMCKNKSMTDEFDGLKFSCMVVANKAEAVLYDGEEALLPTGDALNFKEPAFLDMLGVPKALDGVRKLYGVDGHIFVAADAILSAAGYDSDSQDQQADPTLDS